MQGSKPGFNNKRRGRMVSFLSALFIFRLRITDCRFQIKYEGRSMKSEVYYIFETKGLFLR